MSSTPKYYLEEDAGAYCRLNGTEQHSSEWGDHVEPTLSLSEKVQLPTRTRMHPLRHGTARAEWQPVQHCIPCGMFSQLQPY